MAGQDSVSSRKDQVVIAPSPTMTLIKYMLHRCFVLSARKEGNDLQPFSPLPTAIRRENHRVTAPALQWLAARARVASPADEHPAALVERARHHPQHSSEVSVPLVTSV
jgi:hypothetical protein